MIVDKSNNASQYTMCSAWKKAFDFIHEVTPETPDGRYEIDGARIYALVMSYMTKQPSEGKLEAHKQYADIQVILSGEERIAVTSTDFLKSSEAYNPKQDLVFYECPDSFSAQINLRTGDFAFFLPQDAHMPMICIDQPKSVKKLVVKIDLQTLAR
ncbi:YhcH/YjgK/YiaL family protein [Coraliomargarita sp. SDUM461004]|uniref:YhcH/YjgK/YiaL family protein n=1 Tax=Thalassobacterium sedimentorum TaxID=3041258 RepID=A0ABU1AH23_9BACT|nr:YhcH/YjgK/YiaL family protein [Coraliomargarita sp. SDUM461004]MDQ8192938.1 YhcH/YjgK/YiaL family protein [Coraliomargarita sp. SDUM461004]